MPYAKIPLKFSDMQSAYKDNQTLPEDVKRWLKAQHAIEDKYNAEELPKINEERRKKGLPELPPAHSTSCCMQASLGFNATDAPISKTGSRDRDNTTLDAGKNYILSVQEFRAFLTYKYGPTDQVNSTDEVKGLKGVMIFGNSHIEFWDGEFYLQSAGGLSKYGRNTGAVMSGGMLSSKPMWFWELTGDATAEKSDIPDWLVGWWLVTDGNIYYYYFFKDGSVVYIEQTPNKKWVPPKTIGNRGKTTRNDDIHGFTVLWTPTKGETVGTKEDFTRMNWSSEKEMHGVSTKYAPLSATKFGD